MTTSPSGEDVTSGGTTLNQHNEGVTRLHKPGVAGSSPAAASNALLRFEEALADYHADREWWSKSQLWDLYSRGPEYFAARYLTGTLKYSSSASMERGTRIHEWAEGPDAWWDRVVEIPASVLGKDGRWVKATDEWFAGVKADRPDAICLSSDEVASYRQQTDRLLANAAFRELSSETEHREFSVRWQDAITGTNLRCRPDAATETVLWDLKTTKEQRPLQNFWKSVIDYGYAFQAVMYMEGARAAGINAKQFVFMVTSTVAPYQCHAVVLPEQLLNTARTQLRKVVADLRNRLVMDDWSPEDGGQVTTLFVPRRFMEDRSNDAGSFPNWCVE